MDEPTVKRKKKFCDPSMTDELILQRASEAAVSPEWITSKESVRGWEKITKGKVMKVKKNHEGTFDIINDEN